MFCLVAMAGLAVAAPAVSSLDPNKGASAGGATVTITGTGFTGATGVRFGASTPAESFSVVSDSTITAVVPAGAAGVLYSVYVTGPSGTSAKTTGSLWYYRPDPVVDGLSPAWGDAGGGDTLTIHGDRFTGATAVFFQCDRATGVWGGCVAKTCGREACDDTEVSAFTVVDDDTIEVTVPAGMAAYGAREMWGTVRVEVDTSVSAVDSLEQYFGWVDEVDAYVGSASDPRIAFVGDSITAQAKSTLLADFTTGSPTWQVSVSGHSGYRVAQAAPYAEDYATAADPPDVVVVNLGTNDAMQLAVGGPDLFTIDDSVADLEAMADTFAAAECVVFVTVWTGWWSSYATSLNDTMFAMAAADPRIVVADWNSALNTAILAAYPASSGWLADFVHPSALGRAELVDLVREAIGTCPA